MIDRKDLGKKIFQFLKFFSKEGIEINLDYATHCIFERDIYAVSIFAVCPV